MAFSVGTLEDPATVQNILVKHRQTHSKRREAYQQNEDLLHLKPPSPIKKKKKKQARKDSTTTLALNLTAAEFKDLVKSPKRSSPVKFPKIIQ